MASYKPEVNNRKNGHGAAWTFSFSCFDSKTGKFIPKRVSIDFHSFLEKHSTSCQKRANHGEHISLPEFRLYVCNRQKAVPVPEGLKTVIRKCCRETLREEGFTRPAEVSLTYVDNETIKKINRKYRHKDSETDVLSFPMGEDGSYDLDPDTGCLMLGDIVISLEKAREQAEKYGHSFEREVAFLATHSMLHLLGYDHENSQEEEKIMFQKQSSILDRLGITR